MEAKHIYEDGIYLLSNVSVARNPLFRNRENIERFTKGCEEYLGSLCEIISISCKHNTWEIIARMKNRLEFEEFYREKHSANKLPRYLIPESGYIFSQQMANLQSGFVKHYNWANNRIGSLFYRRYSKFLIKDGVELLNQISKIEGDNYSNVYSGFWAEGCKGVIVDRDNTRNESKEKFNVLMMDGVYSDNLAGWFNILPKLEISDPIPRYLRTIFKILHSLNE